MPQRLKELSERLTDVRIMSGSWERCVTDGVLFRQTKTNTSPAAVFLDPPYRPHLRDRRLYGAVDEALVPMVVNDDIETWCRENGPDPRLRIILAGLDGEYDLPGWRVLSWRAPAASAENRDAERLWLSPYCINPSAQESLF